MGLARRLFIKSITGRVLSESLLFSKAYRHYTTKNLKNEDTQEQAPGYLRWLGNLLYRPGHTLIRRSDYNIFSGGKFSGASSG
ncbi:MAG: hypothetical protein LBI91_01260, partial [Spirochaetaceae bacterium]|nr:hypothetical protein [Spirochaetaceae bacterium]